MMRWGWGLIAIPLFLTLAISRTQDFRPATDRFPVPRVGAVARFQEYPRWDISGTVRVVDARTLRFENFTFQGGEIQAQLQLQRDGVRVAVLRDITQVRYDRATFDLVLPAGVGLADFDLVTVYSRAFGTTVSGAAFRE